MPRQSFCRNNPRILFIEFSKRFASLWQLPQECRTKVTGKEIMKSVRLRNNFNPSAVVYRAVLGLTVTQKRLYMVQKLIFK